MEWLTECGYAARCVHQRVPLLVAFGEFAWAGGARTVQELPGYIDGFVSERMMGRPATRPDGGRPNTTRLRGPVEQMLTVVIPGFVAAGREPYPNPFRDALPGFFLYLQDERGLRPLTIGGYRHHLRRFEQYLSRIGVARLSELSPSILSAFVADRASDGWEVASLADCCGVLRVFLRFAHRERAIGRDLSPAVEWPSSYRLASIPRSITWEEVGRMLAEVDRRSPHGKRDWAILLLLVTSGLRGREVAALTLDDIDWKRERLRVPERKAGHSTAFPLSGSVGDALVDYLKHGRPQSEQRQLFLPGAAAACRVCDRARRTPARRPHAIAAGAVPRLAGPSTTQKLQLPPRRSAGCLIGGHQQLIAASPTTDTTLTDHLPEDPVPV